jgi:hypothetical protein
MLSNIHSFRLLSVMQFKICQIIRPSIAIYSIINRFLVNHSKLIDNDLALANGNDLRVYFRKDEDCRPREIDRILENITSTKTTVYFKLQEDWSETVRDGSAYYLVYGNIII